MPLGRVPKARVCFTFSRLAAVTIARNNFFFFSFSFVDISIADRYRYTNFSRSFSSNINIRLSVLAASFHPNEL